MGEDVLYGWTRHIKIVKVKTGCIWWSPYSRRSLRKISGSCFEKDEREADMNIIIFGTGMLYEKYKNYFLDMHILCFLDNDTEKWGIKLGGKPILPPREVLNYKYDYIFLVSIYYKQMREQLRALNVPDNKIIDRDYLGIFAKINQVRRYEIYNCRIQKKNKGKILLLSHSFSLSGAPVVLTQLALFLRREGYFVEIYTKGDEDEGGLLYQMLSSKIPVSIFTRFDLLDMDDICKRYKMVIVNTIVLHPVIQELSGRNIPVLWWLHEEEDVYHREQIGPNSISVGNNIHVYAVGNRAKAAYEKYSKDSFADIMLYGVKEVQTQKVFKDRGGKLRFALVGYGCERKGQDLVYEVVKRRIHHWEKQIEVWFIGNIPESKTKAYNALSCINCMGIMETKELAEVYDRIDVLLCPSLHDPMPVVVSEAMMHRKTCIVSDMVGQSDYIIPGRNGLVCKAGSMESLEETMQWVIDNHMKLDEIGKAGYDIYKKHFAIGIFQRKALNIVKSLLDE